MVPKFAQSIIRNNKIVVSPCKNTLEISDENATRVNSNTHLCKNPEIIRANCTGTEIYLYIRAEMFFKLRCPELYLNNVF